MEQSAAVPTPDTGMIGENVDQIIAAQNFKLAIPAGICAALVGAALWAVVTILTKAELGVMAVVIGYLVGRAIRAAGGGIDSKFAWLGAACALLGSVLGNVLSDIGFYAGGMNISFGEALATMNVGPLGRLILDSFHPLDLLFLGIAIYEGFAFSTKYKLIRKRAERPAG
jgi:hypothetical protein